MVWNIAKLAFWWNAAQLCVAFPVAWVGSHYGTDGLAVGQAFLMLGLLVPCWYFLIRPTCGARWGEFTMSFLSPLVTGSFAVGVAYLAAMSVNVPVWRLAGMVLVAVPTYFLASSITNRSWFTAMQQLILRRSEA